MTPTEARHEAKDRGFTHVETHGGLVLIDEWTPYGGNEKVVLTWDIDRTNTMYDMNKYGISGVWRFTRETVTP